MATAGPEFLTPRLRQNDVTIERVATLLATVAAKGLLVGATSWRVDVGMSAYNLAARGFLGGGLAEGGHFASSARSTPNRLTFRGSLSACTAVHSLTS